MKFLNIFNKKSISIQKQMENLNLTIEEIKLIHKHMAGWYKDYESNIKRIETMEFMSSIPFASPDQLKLIREQILINFKEQFEIKSTMAKAIGKKLKIFIDSIE